MGITINVHHCLFCAQLLKDDLCLFDPPNGGFVCMECASKRDEFLSDNKLLREEYQSSTHLKKIFELSYKLPYKQYEKLPQVEQGLTISQFNYINLQFGFSKDPFKSWGLISAF